MNIYVLDGSLMEWEADFHEQIQKALGFFVGYGWNLDALSDAINDDSGLMQAKRPFELVWLHSSAARGRMGPVFDTIVEVLSTARDIRLVLK